MKTSVAVLSALFLAACLAAPALAAPAGDDADFTGMSGGPEISYMPGLGVGGASASSTLLITRDSRRQITSWFSIGTQTNLGYQLTGMPAKTGGWVSSFAGLVPRFGLGAGPVRIDLGALLALGGMLRTGMVAGTPDVAELRGLWAVEPRLEVAMGNDWIGGALFGGYLFSSSPSDLGGVVVGLKATFGGKAHEAMMHPSEGKNP